MGKRRDRVSPYNTSLSMPPPPGGGGLVDQKNRESWVHLGGGSDSPWTLPVDLLLNIMYVVDTVFSTYLGAQIFLYKEKDGELIFFASLGKELFCLAIQGFWYFAEKRAKFHGIFRGKFAEKSANFAGFSREKSQNSPETVWFRGILAEKSQISKDFQGQILRKIGQ